MPELAIGFQIGAELTNILPVRQAVEVTGRAILDLARRLRHSGSDFLVEEDVAEIFGRGRIDPKIEEDFRCNVLRDTNVISIQNQSVLVLSTGAGPTFDRALRNPGRGYLATIIQLSLLGWMHDRATLASALDECMTKRCELEIPGAHISPGYDGIYGMLEACNTQTSSFSWSSYSDLVRAKIYEVFGQSQDLMNYEVCLSPGTLLACMDSLFIVQRTPEERLLTVSEPRGLVTLIIWAHYILGLSVLVKSTKGENEGNVVFANQDECSPQIVIEWRAMSHQDPEICLLDSNAEVILTVDKSISGSISRLDAYERLPLQDYGTVLLCRKFNESATTFKDSAYITEAVQTTVAMAIVLIKKLVRITDPKTESPVAHCNIQRWQVYDATSVLFHSVSYEEESINSFVDRMLKKEALKSTALGPALQEYMDKRPNLGGAAAFVRSALIVVVMAAVSGVRDCGDLPIIADNNFMEQTNLWSKAYSSKGYITLEPHELFSEMCILLVGTDLKLNYSEGGNIFMVSDFGWTVCLPSFGDADPARANPETLLVRKGVPTNSKTLERKSRVRDVCFGSLEFEGGRTKQVSHWIVDRGTTAYTPRCISPVLERTEHYGSRKDGFCLSIKFQGQHNLHSELHSVQAPFSISRSYRSFFDGLWETSFTPPCEHSGDTSASLQDAELRLDVVTAAGIWLWLREEIGTKRQQTPERIVVILVKGDPRARWLAVGAAREIKKSRQVMLRCANCCENCAVKVAAVLSGRWLVII